MGVRTVAAHELIEQLHASWDVVRRGVHPAQVGHFLLHCGLEVEGRHGGRFWKE